MPRLSVDGLFTILLQLGTFQGLGRGGGWRPIWAVELPAQETLELLLL